jgi:hypothetical protein
MRDPPHPANANAISETEMNPVLVKDINTSIGAAPSRSPFLNPCYNKGDHGPISSRLWLKLGFTP